MTWHDLYIIYKTCLSSSPSLCPKQFEGIINLVNSSRSNQHVGGELRPGVRCSLHSLCLDLSWYNSYPSRLAVMTPLSSHIVINAGMFAWALSALLSPVSFPLSKSRQEYNIICYILTGSSHTHISQLMVLKIARVSISNDVEMSPVSLYLLEGEIGALAAQWWVLLRQNCVFTEPGNTPCRHHHYNKDLGWWSEGRCGLWGSVSVWLIILFFSSLAGRAGCTCWVTWKPLLIMCSQLLYVTCPPSPPAPCPLPPYLLPLYLHTTFSSR